MITKSRQRATANRHPSLWPFYVLRSLTLWAGLIGAGYGAIAIDSGAGILVGAMWAMYVVFFFGLVPATLVAAIDGVVRSRGRESRITPRRRSALGQDLTRWTLVGGVTGLIGGAGYSVVYVNAFAPSEALADVLLTAAPWGAGAGLVAAWLAAVKLNVLDNFVRATTLAAIIKRGAVLWFGGVAGIGMMAYAFADRAYETTLLPAAVLAVLGAGLVPQLAATPPGGAATESPAPSSGPHVPEGGTGEGARGDWRSAPPPQLPRNDTTPQAGTMSKEALSG